MITVVVGAAGQLGRDLCPRLPGTVIPWTRAEVDLARPETIRPALAAQRPDVVVNCAAYNFVDRAETEVAAAMAVNGWGVRELAAACRELNAVLVHFSTDYVFGLENDRRTPYAEGDAPGPISVYGVSKLAGEYFVRALCPRHYVIRTCGLYGVWGSGGKGGNFVETMLRRAAEGKPLRVVADQVCTPSYTVDVARATAALISTGRYGLYHLTNAGECSWFEFAGTIFELAGVRADLSAINSHAYGAPARRPSYSVLSHAAYEGLGLPPLRPWREALASYLEERRSRAGETAASAGRGGGGRRGGGGPPPGAGGRP
ncbi:MAG: dTDP-4-dehydrorhamnose reductase, partial [Gemmataceae bacterium]|nr:dTDP-4-dehydrorhamnose reductase [Gemmataceae bacterium]MDW8267501.1 dTDP-4-dehydrorhamnose reductase [Gemmataceae bacterium]